MIKRQKLLDQKEIPDDAILFALPKAILSISPRNSLIPFKMIRYIMSNYLDAYMHSIAVSMNAHDSAREELHTSCVHAAYACSVVFFGENAVKKIHTSLRTCSIQRGNFILPSGKNWSFDIIGLLEGNILHGKRATALKEIAEDNLNEPSVISQSHQPFTQYVQPFLAKTLYKKVEDSEIISDLTDYFTNIKYDFNLPTLLALKSEIKDNRQQINLNTSFIYWMAIIEPDININVYGFEHAFLMEQYFSYKYTEIRYRIYQSMIKQASLSDDFNRRGYDEEEKQTWNEGELHDFLNNLEGRYCRNKDLQEPVSFKTCFGYENLQPNLIRFEENILTGVHLQYYSASINPGDCIKNLAEFVNSSPELKSVFLKESGIQKKLTTIDDKQSCNPIIKLKSTFWKCKKTPIVIDHPGEVSSITPKRKLGC